MTKRSKQKTASAFKSHQSATVSMEPILHAARTFPILDCWISNDWEQGSGLVQIILTRQQPNEKICCGIYLVDKYCLGLKNTFAKVNLSPERFQEIFDKSASKQPLTKCPIELAHEMIYASIDYAAKFGFEPQSDWAQTQYILEPRGQLKERYKLKFGKNGKPLFIPGPYDDTNKILKQLEATAGHGKYDYILMLGKDI